MVRSLSLLLLLAGSALADPIPLKVEGDTVLVVKSYPCTVTAPAGADFYHWSCPDALTASAVDNVLTIKAGPPSGTFTVGLTTLTFVIDFKSETKTKVKNTGETVLQVGVPKPPPPPEPEDPLCAKFQAAFDADHGDPAAKLAAVKSLAALYTQAVSFAGSLDAGATAGDLAAKIKAAGSTLVPAGVVAGVRAAIGQEIAGAFNLNAPLTDASRKQAAELFAKIAAALSKIK